MRISRSVGFVLLLIMVLSPARAWAQAEDIGFAPVPRRLEKEFLARGSWGYGQIWDSVAALGAVRRIPVTAARDRGSLTGLSLPVADAARAGNVTS